MEVTPALAPSRLPFAHLIANADPIVQAVMLGLAVASLVCWSIGVEKLLRYFAFSQQVRWAEESAINPSGDKHLGHWLADRFQKAAGAEPRTPLESRSEFQAHLERSLQAEIALELRRLQSGLPLLATVGSTAPFVGLFGTVWGIMNSFAGIAAAKDTSLAVVAPGIAEALLATAIGLVAAIPAVIFYNLANVWLSSTAERLSIAAARYARHYIHGMPGDGTFNPETSHREREALTNGGMDTR